MTLKKLLNKMKSSERLSAAVTLAEHVSLHRKVLIPIRFSVLSQSKAWVISRDNKFEQYKEKLFSQERLSSKFFLFENLVLPNLQELKSSLSDIDVQVLVITSTHLPAPYRQSLDDLVKDTDFIAVKAVDEKAKLNTVINDFVHGQVKQENKDCAYATVRLDDDDLLSSKYIKSLRKFITPEFAGSVISFPKGYESLYNFQTRKTETNIRVSWPRIALGLAHINYFSSETIKYSDKVLNIYGVGDHTKVDKTHPLIVDHGRGMFLRMSYSFQDTESRGIKERIKRRDCAFVEIEEVLEDFPLLGNILTDNAR